MDVFPTFVRFAFDPVSIEVFENAVEVFCGLGESVPLFRVVFQELFILVLGCFLLSMYPM
jgi:hypothetical protein